MLNNRLLKGSVGRRAGLSGGRDLTIRGPPANYVTHARAKSG